MRIPCCAPFPVPTIIAVGVANPNAQGQAMTRTATAAIIAKENAAPKMENQITKVKKEMKITMGTKYAEIISANLSIGARDACASSISLIILESVVFAPTFVAFKVNISTDILNIIAPKTKV